MTSKRLAAPSAAPGAVFPERPPRMDMQNFIYLNRPGHATAIARLPRRRRLHPGHRRYPRGLEPQRTGKPALPGFDGGPFDVDLQAVIADRGFSIDDQGKPPEFVLEVASVRTARNDYTTKRDRYASYGVSEYWRFDPSDPALPRAQRRYPEPLAGDALVDASWKRNCA